MAAGNKERGVVKESMFTYGIEREETEDDVMGGRFISILELNLH